eukprot:gene7463-8732_t
MGYIVTQIPAQFLCNAFGGKLVYFSGVTLSVVATLFIPLAAENKVALVALRIITGICQGGVGLGWSALWFIFVRDNPKDTWGIHPSELYLITSNLDDAPIENQALLYNYGGAINSTTTTAVKEPTYGQVVRKLFSKTGIYALLYYNLTTAWGFYLLLMWYPTWLTQEIKIPAGSNSMSFFTVLPYLSSFAISNISGVITDLLLARGVRKIVLRKVFGALNGLIPGSLLLVISYAQMAPDLKLALMVTAIASTGFGVLASNINTLDLAPQHAGIVMGIGNFFATIPGILGSLLAGTLLAKFGSWVPIFVISSSFYFSAVLVWVLFAQTDRVI